MWFEVLATVVDYGTKERLTLVKVLPHVDVLCSLASENEHNRRITAFASFAPATHRVGLSQEFSRFSGICGNYETPLCQLFPPNLQRIGGIRKATLWCLFQMPCQRPCVGIERGGGSCREEQELQGTRLGERPPLRGLLQNHVDVRASKAEGTDSGPSRYVSPGKWDQPVRDSEGTIGKIHLWVGRLEMQQRRNLLAVEHQSSADETRNTRGICGVPDIAFD
jgi:hypothetical protein